MPVMDGCTAARVLRRELGFAMLVVGVTGNVMDDDVEAYLNAGADAVLMKPIQVRRRGPVGGRGKLSTCRCLPSPC